MHRNSESVISIRVSNLIVSLKSQEISRGFCAPGEFYPLHIFLCQCVRSHVQGQVTGAMRKGK